MISYLIFIYDIIKIILWLWTYEVRRTNAKYINHFKITLKKRRWARQIKILICRSWEMNFRKFSRTFLMAVFLITRKIKNEVKYQFTSHDMIHTRSHEVILNDSYEVTRGMTFFLGSRTKSLRFLFWWKKKFWTNWQFKSAGTLTMGFWALVALSIIYTPVWLLDLELVLVWLFYSIQILAVPRFAVLRLANQNAIFEKFYF